MLCRVELGTQIAHAVLLAFAWKNDDVQPRGFVVAVAAGLPEASDGKVAWRFDAFPPVTWMPAADPPPPTAWLPTAQTADNRVRVGHGPDHSGRAVEPVTPVAPVGPVGPVLPVPVAPVAPVAPVGPVSPVAPAAPVLPVAPVAPA